jgi:hypothetical protein
MRNAVITINAQCVQVHSFTPAEILLGFNSAVTRSAELPEGRDTVSPTINLSDIFSIEADELQAYITQRDDKSVSSAKMD